MKQNALAKAEPQSLANRSQLPPAIIQQDIAPAQYQTGKSRGLPAQPVHLPKLPAILPLTLAAIIAITFLVAASMFSISLTAYSNSVDRVDRSRSFTHVE